MSMTNSPDLLDRDAVAKTGVCDRVEVAGPPVPRYLPLVLWDGPDPSARPGLQSLPLEGLETPDDAMGALGVSPEETASTVIGEDFESLRGSARPTA